MWRVGQLASACNFRSEFKRKGPFRFIFSTGLFGTISGSGPLISVGIFLLKFAVPFLTNRLFALIKEFGKGIKIDKSHTSWLTRFNRKMSFHFPRVFLYWSLTGRFGTMDIGPHKSETQVHGNETFFLSRLFAALSRRGKSTKTYGAKVRECLKEVKRIVHLNFTHGSSSR